MKHPFGRLIKTPIRKSQISEFITIPMLLLLLNVFGGKSNWLMIPRQKSWKPQNRNLPKKAHSIQRGSKTRASESYLLLCGVGGSLYSASNF